jgi:hypothetical protein
LSGCRDFNLYRLDRRRPDGSRSGPATATGQRE